MVAVVMVDGCAGGGRNRDNSGGGGGDRGINW